MVCEGDGIVCIPNHSQSGLSRCLAGSVRCNGRNDCRDGTDEESCPLSLPSGLQALVALSVIAVIILVPLLYACIRRKQGMPVIPDRLRPLFSRVLQISPCCAKTKGRSAQQLTSGNAQNSSANKDGFTNVSFETGNSPGNSAQTQNYSITGRPLNKFKQTVNEDELERAPSYRDWQANRLQPQTQTQTKATSVRNPESNSSSRIEVNNHNANREYGGNKLDHRAGVDRVHNNNSELVSDGRRQQHAVSHTGPITYVPGARRTPQDTTETRLAYSIASPDGRSNYEARSHLQSDDGLKQDTRQHYRHYAPRHQQHFKEPPPIYEFDAGTSSAVPPNQLREALEKVTVSHPHNGDRFQAHVEYENSADTVV